ncbi:T9SS-dependent choice-of-anchor J family protein [Psychroserpens jangbogonensis]|uniref:T9SS-dependent choice-of-anchor J family protein n=1 Tax=Psychroserpens jangbogonensis TaxID=1484460 RepID=UPI000AE855DB|nr:T9SS type A sorting domain-containing protein [Psychroserpens jangbogonensis]
MKNFYVTLLFGLLVSHVIFSQTTLYSEDFTGQNGKGIIGAAFGGSNTDLSGVDWTIDVSSASIGADFFGGNEDYFRVTSEAFAAKDTDGNAFWLSPSFTIAGYVNVSLSLDAFTSGNNDAADLFVTQYRIDGGTWITAATNGNLNDDFNLVVSQTGLTGSTLEIRIQVDNDADNEITTFDNVLVEGVVPACSGITGLTINSSTSNTADISWTAGGTETGWEIVVQAAGTGTPAGAGTPLTTNAYIDVSLSGSTAYEVYVRADCSNTSDGLSAWAGPLNFTTPYCSSGTSSYIFTEEFDSQGSWTGDITTSNQNGDWEIPDNSGSGSTGPNSAFSGSNFMNYEASGSTTATASAVSPAINLSTANAAELSFYLHAYGSGMGTLNVGASTSVSGPFTTLFTQAGQLQTSSGAAWELVNISLGAYVGQTIYIEFSHTGTGAYQGDMSIDFLRVQTCVLPGPANYTFTSGSWDTDPNGISTTIDNIIIASGDATIDTNTVCNSVTVNSGAGLTVDSGVILATSSDLTLESSSTSYSSLILDGTVSGTLIYERHVNINGSGITGSNDLISAPLTGQAFNDFATANPNILNNGTLYLFGPYDKASGEYITYAGSATTPLDPGVGYRSGTTDNGTVTFTGTANNGTISVDIQNFGPVKKQWNLVGNPYPSYLNVQAFLNHDVGGVTNLALFAPFSAAIYGYDGIAQDDWTIYNLANTTASTVIAPGQGFFVSANATSVPLYDLEFTPAMRRTGTSDDFIVGRNAELIYVKLNASTSNNSYTTEIYFNNNSSLGFDLGYDAELYGTAPDFAIYSNLVQDNSDKAINLQSLNSSDITEVTIPLGVNANQGEQLTFSIADMTLPTSVNVYLDDTVANTITLLNNSDYVISPTTDLSGTGRFFLRISEDALSTIDNSLDNIDIFTLKASDELVIRGQLSDNSMLNLYDIQGRLVLSTKLDNTLSQNRIDVSSINSGVYIVTIQNNSQEKTKKVIIN